MATCFENKIFSDISLYQERDHRIGNGIAEVDIFNGSKIEYMFNNKPGFITVEPIKVVVGEDKNIPITILSPAYENLSKGKKLLECGYVWCPLFTVLGYFLPDLHVLLSHSPKQNSCLLAFTNDQGKSTAT